MDPIETIKFSLAVFAIATVIAWIVEAMVEFFAGLLFDYFPASWAKFKRLIAVVAATGFGVAIAYHYQIDLVAALMNVFGLPHPPDGYGIFISGVSMGRGADFIHQLFTRFFPKQ